MLIEEMVSKFFPKEWNLLFMKKNYSKKYSFNIKQIIKKINVVPESDCLEYTRKSLTTSKTINSIRRKIPLRHLMYALFFEEPGKGCIVEQTCRHVSICLHSNHLKLVQRKRKNTC